jgi:hypothetical protein
MFRGLKPQMSRNLLLKQHARQFPIHIQLGSIKINKDVEYGVNMHPHMQASLGRSACMYAKRVRLHYPAFFIVDLLFVSLWNPRASIGLVPCVMVSRSIVVHWDGAWSASYPWSAVLSAEVGQVRAGSALLIAAPRQRALYPSLPFSTLP